MTVATFDPNAQPTAENARFHMTDAALAHARKQLKRQTAKGLRLAVKQSGCSGYMYALQFVATPTEADAAFTMSDDVVLYVDRASLHLVNGTEIDYVSEGLNSTLKFRNPNATAECGCGESFAVD